jgi:hypothetical protein
MDEFNLISSLGAIAGLYPLAMVQTLRSGAITYLGTAVVPIGRAQTEDLVLQIRALDKRVDVRAEVYCGTLQAFPLQSIAPGTILELVPARGIDVGAGAGRSTRVEFKGGAVGLIVDARGRPMQFADDPETRRQRVDDWLLEMMGG